MKANTTAKALSFLSVLALVLTPVGQVASAQYIYGGPVGTSTVSDSNKIGTNYTAIGAYQTQWYPYRHDNKIGSGFGSNKVGLGSGTAVSNNKVGTGFGTGQVTGGFIYGVPIGTSFATGGTNKTGLVSTSTSSNKVGLGSVTSTVAGGYIYGGPTGTSSVAGGSNKVGLGGTSSNTATGSNKVSLGGSGSSVSTSPAVGGYIYGGPTGSGSTGSNKVALGSSTTASNKVALGASSSEPNKIPLPAPEIFPVPVIPPEHFFACDRMTIAATDFVKIERVDEELYEVYTFTDVVDGRWQTTTVETVSTKEVTKILDAHNNNYECRVITREEFHELVIIDGFSEGSNCFERPYPLDIDGHWSEIYVRRLYDLCIVEGYEDGTFRPDQEVTRAELTKMSLYSMGIEPDLGCYDNDCGSPFIDLDPWQGQWVRPAWFLNIVEGYRDGTFRPNTSITRAEAVKIVLATYGYEPINTNDSYFNDVHGWSVGWIETAHEIGLVQGVGNGNFDPKRPITRGEAAKIIAKMMEYWNTKIN